MSIFDLTPPGAFMDAIMAANAKDRLNARRFKGNPARTPQGKRIAGETLIARIRKWAHKVFVANHMAIGLRSKAQ